MNGSRSFRRSITAVIVAIGIIAIAICSFTIFKQINEREFKPDPSVIIDSTKKYNLEIWIPGGIQTAARTELRDYIDRRCDTYRGKYNNVLIRIKEIEYSQFQERLEQAVDSGSPPDIALCLDGTFAYYGSLQIPIEGYLSSEDFSRFTSDALRGVSSEKGVLGWPLGFKTELWAVRPGILQESGVAPTDWLSGELQLDDLFVRASEASKAIVLLEPTVGLLNQFFISNRNYSKSGAVWSPQRVKANTDLLLKAADNSEQYISTGYLSKFAEGTILTMAPIRMELANLLVESSGGDPEKLLLLPGPVAARQNHTPAEIDAVVVFRQKRFKGHDQLKAAVELVRALGNQSQELQSMLLHYPVEKGQTAPPVIGGQSAEDSHFICSPPVLSSELLSIKQRIIKDVIPYLTPGGAESKSVTEIIDRLNNVQAVNKFR